MLKNIVFIFAISGIVNSSPIVGRIFEGDLVPSDTIFPFIVSLVSNIRGILDFGGGTIITANTILTAARNVESAAYTDVGYGSRYIAAQTIQRVYPSNFIYYPQYNSTFYTHNIALVRLTKDIVFNLYVQPVQLTRRSYAIVDNFKGQIGTIVGWGMFSEIDYLLSDSLRATSAVVIENMECATVFSSNVVISASMCSVGYNKLVSNACWGDFGGPLIVQDGGVRTQIGVISFGRACPAESPTGYASVAFYLNWIEQQTGLVIRD